MPIRINLLAEHQAAEEARRKDPVMRTVYAGVALLILTIVWILWYQHRINVAKAELAQLAPKYALADATMKEINNKKRAVLDAEQRVKSLQRYATDRLLWGTFLKALQEVSVDNVRLMSARVEQKYTFAPTNALPGATTNMNLPYPVKAPFWKFWSSSSKAPPPLTNAWAQLKALTNQSPIFLNHVKSNAPPWTAVLAITQTNEINRTVQVKADFIVAPFETEEATAHLTARDYTRGPGKDELVHRLQISKYFLDHGLKGQNAVRPSGTGSPRTDPGDFLDPINPFVEFQVDYLFDRRVLINE
jgi:hypothetical protein